MAFQRLALAIVDEQHRFGVEQRMMLRHKGEVPHHLVMTATPIPRTLTMALYADMDVSVIDELPPGRQAVRTRVVTMSRRNDVIAHVGQAVAAGAQVYWVCTVIDGQEGEVGLAGQAQAAETTTTGEAPPSIAFRAAPRDPERAATTTFDELQEMLPDVRSALVHGRLPATEKATAMAAFKAGEIDLLVATTVIEVGVDVPNASLMVIDNAERLGLAQLHQLRGRVGRGSARSDCVLLYQPPLSEVATQRLAVLRQDERRLRHRREGPRTARPRRHPRHPPNRRAGLPHRRSGRGRRVGPTRHAHRRQPPRLPRTRGPNHFHLGLWHRRGLRRNVTRRLARGPAFAWRERTIVLSPLFTLQSREPLMPTDVPPTVLLVVLDGWGHAQAPAEPGQRENAIAAAHTPVWDRLWAHAPTTLLSASSEDVGLPAGQMGNSEVGHMNLGAGRVMRQDLTRIDHAIATGDFFANPALEGAIDASLASGGALHVLGLLSRGRSQSRRPNCGIRHPCDRAGSPGASARVPRRPGHATQKCGRVP